MMIKELLKSHLLIVLSIFPCAVLATDISSERQQELLHLIKHDCGSCHGMTLKGGLGSSLTAEKLQHKPSEFLSNVIMNGIKGTPMPPWKAILAEQEIAWVVEQLKAGVLEIN